MKILYLVRHAKSSWEYPQLDDFERPLNHRGRNNAPFMGDVLKKRGVSPDLILSSPANRAATTARIIAAKINYSLEDIMYTESMYGAGEGKMIDLIKSMHNDINKLMIVGHNPGMTHLANSLGNGRVSNIPTCGIYCVHLKISTWNMIQDQRGNTEFFEFPKKYVA